MKFCFSINNRTKDTPPFPFPQKNIKIKVHPLGECWYEGRCYYINCSTWNGPRELAVPIYGFVMPAILAVTFLSNILIIIVLSKRHMRSPTNMVRQKSIYRVFIFL